MAPSVGLGTEGPVQRGWSLWLASVVGVVIAALFVGARLVQRLMKIGLGMDDYVIVAALISSGMLSMTECQAVVYGYGRKYADIPPEARIKARQWFYGAQIVYKIVPTLTKVSIVCLYYRIFAVQKSWFRTACHVMNAFIISAGVAFTIATIFQCTPIAAFWDRTIVGAKCFKNEPWWISFSVIQIVTDFVLLALPIGRVWRLSMTRAEKIGLVLVFCTGGFVTFASIYRATTIAGSASDPDPTWGPIPATVWSVIEVNAGIVCACLPMLRQPFLKLLSPLIGSVRTQQSNNRSYQLTSRSGKRSVGLQSGKNGMIIDDLEDLKRESEERIIRANSGNGSPRVDGRNSPEGIMVKQEISITTSPSNLGLSGYKKQRFADPNGAESVTEDKSSGKSTYIHV